MGYCMYHVDSEFFIPKKSKAAALKSIKALAGKETIRDSGGAHFSWVNNSAFVKAITLQAAIKAWRWSIEEDPNGDVVGIYFDGEKEGDDYILFEALAPFIRKGSFIQMRGEDDCTWRWVFDGKGVRETTPKTTWPDD